MNEELREMLKGISEEFRGVKTEMAETLKQQENELKEKGETVDKTATRVEELNGRMEDLSKGIEEVRTNVEKMGADPGSYGIGRGGNAKSLGEMFTESEQYAGAKGRRFVGDSEMFPVKSFDPRNNRKALTSDEGPRYGQMGWMIEPQDLGLLDSIREQLTLRQLMTSIQTTSDTVSFIQELGFANLYTELDASILSSATSFVVKSTAGFFVGQEIFLAAAATPETKTSRIVTAINDTTRTITVNTAVGTAFAANDPVTADAIGMTPHGVQKPEASLLGLVEVQYPVGTVAHYMVVHRQTLADAPQLQGIINDRLMYGLGLSVEKQILYGNGTSPNLRGILNDPNIQTIDNVASGDKDANGVWRLDHVRRAITKTQIAELPPDNLMIHPLDWQEIELAKGSDNHYVWANVNDGGVERLWRVGVNVTMQIREAEFLLGAFKRGAYMLDREDANLRIADQHKDFFTSNMLAILAEERLGLAVVRPQAFTKGSFA